MSSLIHPTAVIDSRAEIGADVSIGPFSVIGEHVVIGRGCQIGPHVVIQGRTRLGAENRVFQFASIGAQPQDLKFHGEPSVLEIGARNQIREFVTLQPGTKHGLMKTVIGDGNLFMANSHVAHDCIVGSNNVFANSCALGGHVVVEDHVILGGMAGVHQWTRIGRNALLGGGSMVNQDIPPYCIGQGDRCRLRGINLIGLRRAGFSAEEISGIKQAYRAIFLEKGALQEKISRISDEPSSEPRVQLFIDFIKQSIQQDGRGVTMPSRAHSQSLEE